MEPARGHNLHTSSMEASKIMVYFEKHRLFEIFRRLVAELSLARPSDIPLYVRENIKSIDEEVSTTRTCILTPPIFDNETLADIFKKSYNIPAIIYTKQRNGCDGDIILKKFKKFLRHYGLERKNLIFFNFPDCRMECLQFHKERMDPSSVVEVVPSFQVPFKTRKMLEDEDACYLWKYEQVKSYYSEIFRSIQFGPLDYNNTEGNVMQTVEEITCHVIELMRHKDLTPQQTALGSFLPRVIILGRKGSGRKTQVKALANALNLVFIDMEKLVFLNLKLQSPLGSALRCSVRNYEYSDAVLASILYNRILQKDCLQNGWVVVGYPYNLQGFNNMEKFIVQPNKIVFIHCRERVAIRRLEKYIETAFKNMECAECDSKFCLQNIQACQTMRDEFAQELKFFNVGKSRLLKYLATRNETIHIDGNHSVATVKSKILARINQEQYQVGLQKNRRQCSSRDDEFCD